MEVPVRLHSPGAMYDVGLVMPGSAHVQRQGHVCSPTAERYIPRQYGGPAAADYDFAWQDYQQQQQQQQQRHVVMGHRPPPVHPQYHAHAAHMRLQHDGIRPAMNGGHGGGTPYGAEAPARAHSMSPRMGARSMQPPPPHHSPPAAMPRRPLSAPRRPLGVPDTAAAALAGLDLSFGLCLPHHQHHLLSLLAGGTATAAPAPQQPGAAAAVSPAAASVDLGPLYAPAPPGVLELETVSRMLVPNIKVGAVIGKGGSIVKQIREASGAKVTISDSCTALHDDVLEDRTITCTGPFAAVGAAFGMILSHCGVIGFGDTLGLNGGCGGGGLGGGGSMAGGGGGGGGSDGLGPDGLPHVCRLLVPNSRAGGLIGRGGATIKAIREHSGARIEISSQAYHAHPPQGGGGGMPGSPIGGMGMGGMGMGGGGLGGMGGGSIGGVGGGGIGGPQGVMDRVVTVTGTFDACLRAHHLIIARVMDMGQLPGTLSPTHGGGPAGGACSPIRGGACSPHSVGFSTAGPGPSSPMRMGGPPPAAAMVPHAVPPPPQSPQRFGSPVFSASSHGPAPSSPIPPMRQAPVSPPRLKPPPLAFMDSDLSGDALGCGDGLGGLGGGPTLSSSPGTNAFSMPTLQLTPTTSADSLGGGGSFGRVNSDGNSGAGGGGANSPVTPLSPARTTSPSASLASGASGNGGGGGGSGPGSFDYAACLSDFFGGSSSKPRPVRAAAQMPTSPSVTRLTITLKQQAMSRLGGTGLADIGMLSGAVLAASTGSAGSAGDHSGSFNFGSTSGSSDGSVAGGAGGGGDGEADNDMDVPAAPITGRSSSSRKTRIWSADTETSDPTDDEEPGGAESAATAAGAAAAAAVAAAVMDDDSDINEGSDACPFNRKAAGGGGGRFGGVGHSGGGRGRGGDVELYITGTAEAVQLAQLMLKLRISSIGELTAA